MARAATARRRRVARHRRLARPRCVLCERGAAGNRPGEGEQLCGPTGEQREHRCGALECRSPRWRVRRESGDCLGGFTERHHTVNRGVEHEASREREGVASSGREPVGRPARDGDALPVWMSPEQTTGPGRCAEARRRGRGWPPGSRHHPRSWVDPRRASSSPRDELACHREAPDGRDRFVAGPSRSPARRCRMITLVELHRTRGSCSDPSSHRPR